MILSAALRSVPKGDADEGEVVGRDSPDRRPVDVVVAGREEVVGEQGEGYPAEAGSAAARNRSSRPHMYM